MSNTHKYIDTATKVLAALVIPLIVWGVKLEVNLAVMKTEQAAVEAEIQAIKEENKTVLKSVQDNNTAMRELSVTMGYIKERVDEIRTEIKQ
tara:strand:+ start:1616 stop:1891 length:276 start_codon:yes stop_codon:yes gene_type:complete